MTAIEPIRIGHRAVGPDHPPFIVAELCANHNGSLERALAILDAAKAAGADAVKLQTYSPETMTLDRRDAPFLLKGGLWDGRSLYELYQQAQLPRAWHAPLFARGRDLGLTVFSTPFDETAVDFLEQFDPPAYKIASLELLDIPLVERVAATGRPLILSTGNADQGDIRLAVHAARSAGARNILLLHCINAYPAPIADSNLRLLPELEKVFRLPVGLSDHSSGTVVATAAVALGACLIEKHFTLSRAGGGLDDSFSIEPSELAQLVEAARAAWTALGTKTFQRAPSEAAMRTLRRSLYVVRDLRKGDEITHDSVRALRPFLGLSPSELPKVLGRRIGQDVAAGTPLSWSLID
jgi:pseudaminic acid synthase